MDKEYIKSLLQRILNKEFKSIHRQKIVDYHDRLNFCCPYCGDGKSDYKKRGNIWFNRLFYVCFNCGKKTTFDTFCKNFDEQIDPDKKLEIMNYLDEVMTYSDYDSDFIDAKFEDLIDMSELERVFSQNLTQITDFTPIKEGSGVYKYLVGRGITPNLHKNIYQAKFWRNEDQYEWVIAMLNRKGDKILGLQIRNLKYGKNRLFKIYNYENLLEWVNIGKENVKEMDINQLIIYNKLSYYFNILNVNFDSKITVFEGYLDSLFYPNSIGLVGVNTSYKFLETNDLDIQYFFDNDEAGFKKSEEKLKEGFSVFLWRKFFDHMVEKKKSKEPYKLYNRISTVKDLNKLNEITPNAFKKLELYNYFSQDILDIKWIPKQVKKKPVEKDYNKKLDNFKYL